MCNIPIVHTRKCDFWILNNFIYVNSALLCACVKHIFPVPVQYTHSVIWCLSQQLYGDTLHDEIEIEREEEEVDMISNNNKILISMISFRISRNCWWMFLALFFKCETRCIIFSIFLWWKFSPSIIAVHYTGEHWAWKNEKRDGRKKCNAL